MYLMCLVSYVTRDNLYALKTVSVIFDYVAALAMFLLVYEITCNVRRSIIGMALVLLCPTVIINSAYWCQCDVIYTSFVLLSLLYFYRDNSVFFQITGAVLCTVLNFDVVERQNH